MDQSLHQISIPGPTLACLLRDFSSSHGDCDGILFGRFTTTVSSQLDDSDEASSPREYLNAIITGFCSAGSSRNFYDACGRISPQKLSKLVGGLKSRTGDPVIGWFIGRRNTPMRPSLRDMAVTRSLVASAKALLSNDGASSTERSSNKDKPCEFSQSGRIESVTDSSPPHGEGRLNWRSTTDTGLVDSSAVHLHPQSPEDTNVMDQQASSDVIEQLISLNDAHERGVSTSSSDMAATFSDQKASANDAKRHPSCGGFSLQSSSTFLFLLLTELGMGQAVHTHDYRVYQYHFQLQIFEPKVLKIINIGPVFRGQYDAFSPIAHFPLFPFSIGGEIEDNVHSNIQIKANSDLLLDGINNASVPFQNEQAILDMYSEGYKVDGLTRLLEHNGVQVVELEALYSKMLLKLESLAKQVSNSSSKLLQQEIHNSQLRRKISGHQ